MGLVSQVFDESTLESLKGHLAIGHARYSTTGASTWHNAQPTFQPDGDRLDRAGPQRQPDQHRRPRRDGRRRSRTERRARPPPRGCRRRRTNDTAVVTALLAHHPDQHGRGDAPSTCCRCSRAPSRSSGWTSTRCTPPATRRASGRSCWAGSSAAGSSPRRPRRSTSSARAFIREIEPGEMIAVDEDGLRTQQVRRGRAQALPLRVRLPRPPRHDHRRPADARACASRSVAGSPGVPRRGRPGHPGARSRAPRRPSATPRKSGIPYGMGLVKNSYVGRTFIQPSQTIRQLGIRLKLNPLRDVIEGKRLVVVDDSIVRGNTQRALVRMLREAGAAEVHVRISSPPVKWPCFYGIDFATRAELIANGLTNDEIRRSIDADSLGYIVARGPDRGDVRAASPTCAARASTASTRSSCPSRAARQAPPRDRPAERDGAAVSSTTPERTERESENLHDRAADRRRLRRRLRRGRCLHRGRRPRRRPDEGLGREGPPARDDRRHRRVRRPLRRQRADVLRPPAAGHLHRRRRHQGRDRAGDGRARHHRLRPRRHGRRRPRRVWRRAALHDRLHRHRPGRPRADRRDRQGHRRGLRRSPAAR